MSTVLLMRTPDAWSIFNGPLTRELGVVAQAADDWALNVVVPIFSTCAVSLGLTTFFLGPWAERSGPRKVAVAAGVCWSSALAVTSLGVMTHTLPLLYLGYGVLGGMGWGLGYISPVSTLIKWFPDRRGLATGLALTAFGGGAMLATPVNEALLQYFTELPTFLGSVDQVTLLTQGGKRFAEVISENGTSLQEIVVATKTDLSRAGIIGANAVEGVYVVGTGNSGSAKTFLSLSAAYFVAMMTGALSQRVPAEGWTPKGFVAPQPSADTKAMVTSRSVHYTTALKTPQFWLLWTAVVGNAIAGVSIISSAKTMMSEIFGAALPAIVTGAFSGAFVMALSAGNMTGRFMWANISDFVGRKNTYALFGLGIPLTMLMPTLTSMAIENAQSTLPLILFYGSSVLIVSFYGGIFSVLPAYLADVFGLKHVGAIHGRALTAWSVAAAGGPLLLASLRSMSYNSAIKALVDQCDPAEFAEKFGAPVTQISELMTNKSVTIPLLLEIAPVGTVDPTPTLYDTTLYTMGGLLTVAFIANSIMKPVDAKFLLAEGPRKR